MAVLFVKELFFRKECVFLQNVSTIEGLRATSS